MRQLLSRVSGERLCDWASGSNRGAFVVCALLELEEGEVSRRVAEMLTPVLPIMAESELKGQQAIHKKLLELNGHQT